MRWLAIVLSCASCAPRASDVVADRGGELVVVRREAERRPALTPTRAIPGVRPHEERDDVDRTDDFDLARDGARLARAPIGSRELVAVGAADPPPFRLRATPVASLVVRDAWAAPAARDAIEPIRTALSRCHALLLARDPRAAGALILVFTVDAQGETVHVAANPDAALGEGRACFEAGARPVRFAPARVERRTITIDATLT